MSERENDICDQGKVQIGSGKFSVETALSKFFEQLNQALKIAEEDGFSLIGQSEENQQEIKDYEYEMEKQLNEHPGIFLEREFHKLRREQTKKFEQDFSKNMKDRFYELKGKLTIGSTSSSFKEKDISKKSSSTATERKIRAKDIKLENDLSSSIKSELNDCSTSTTARLRRSSRKTNDGDRDHPIELQESTSSSSSAGSLEDDGYDDDYEVESNFEIRQDQPPAVALAGSGSTIISDTEDNVGADCLSVSVASAMDTSKVLKRNATNKRKAKEQRTGPRRKRIPRYPNPIYNQDMLPFNETHPRDSSSESESEE